MAKVLSMYCFSDRYRQGVGSYFFSYTLSMIPAWQPALDAALANLKPGGHLMIVDFADQRRLPRWFAGFVQNWLSRFGVYHDPALLVYLRHLHEQRQGCLQVRAIGADYAFLAVYQKRACD
jgi:S-adenosylmethionine-diacylgycerolhomoserine-N-methlytransferase